MGILSRTYVCLCALLVGAIAHLPEQASAASDVLSDYVAKSDESFVWRTHARYRAGLSEVVELRLHSQTWRDILWKHQLYLIKPSRIETPNQGLLIIGGGRWREEYETGDPSLALPDGGELFVQIAERLGTVVAVLGQVPFQRLFGMTEDHLIAYTFEQYLNTDDPEWPLLLPMVKSTVRAIDAVQEAASAEWESSLEAFTVLGGSKRGWTAWLVAAVDSRVNALVPTVIDVLNMEQHFPYQSEVWGAPSDKISPYTNLNLHEILASPAGFDLREIVDPFSYRSMLEQPKLIVVASNDEYFPLDSLNLYWDELSGPKFALYLPNDQHSIRDYARLIPTLGALHRYAAGGAVLPELAWEFRSGESELVLCIRSDRRPERVSAWLANSSDRDFRDAVWGEVPLTAVEDSFVHKLARPSDGYSAVFGEIVYGEGDSAYSLSTNVNVFASRASADGNRSLPSHGDACPPNT